ncbi:MAG: metal ABC transporter substrate-binding protein [Dehalococcoidales bacterium]|nr:MAG: metal ABC transporter substrate-binding protein [Dehalococcoidales bacterium]
MKELSVLITGIVVIGLVTSSFLGGCTSTDTSKLQVITTTSLLTYIVEQVGGDLVDVTSLILGSQHPGDFDASPQDIQNLADADLFLYHGWPGETFVPDLIEATDNPDLTVVKIEVAGNWMTPPVQIAATELVAAFLSDIDISNATTYEQSAEDYKAAVLEKGNEILARLSDTNVPGAITLCTYWQVGFAEWVGLQVVASYGPAELTPQDTQELIDTGRAENVELVIDNLQSGRDAGEAIADELDCARVIFSNFPGGYNDTETWEEAIDYNIDLLLEEMAP